MAAGIANPMGAAWHNCKRCSWAFVSKPMLLWQFGVRITFILGFMPVWGAFTPPMSSHANASSSSQRGLIPISFRRPASRTMVSAASAYGHLGLSFEPNEGQADANVAFLAHGAGSTLFLTSTDAVLSGDVSPNPRNF